MQGVEVKKSHSIVRPASHRRIEKDDGVDVARIGYFPIAPQFPAFYYSTCLPGYDIENTTKLRLSSSEENSLAPLNKPSNERRNEVISKSNRFL